MAPNREPANAPARAWSDPVLLGLSALKLLALLLLSDRYGYYRDELYHLVCGTRLDFGFVDHPPLVPAVAAIGDSTFSHGGITPLLSAVQQDVNLTVLVVDNDTVGMTGTQRSMSTGSTLDQIILGAGVAEDHLRIIEPIPKNHDANVETMREELAFEGPSVIVARRACIEALKRKH